MPQSWTCTACGSQWILEQAASIAGTLRRCSKCGARVRVPLKCPECQMDLETPQGELGGRSFRCERGHVFRVPLSRDELLQRLSALGAMESEFDQSARLSQLPDSRGALKARVDGGYCAGICLDWIRRVVQGGRPTYQVAERDKADRPRTPGQIAQREQAQTVRGASAWVARYDGGKREIERQRALFVAMRQKIINAQLPGTVKDQELHRVDEIWDGVKKRYPLMIEAYNNGDAAAQTKLEPWIEKFDRMIADMNVAVGKWNQVAGMSPTQRVWPEFRRLMDGFEASQRAGTGRSATKRPFAGLALELSTPSKSYPDPGALIAGVLSDGAFQPTRAALVGYDAAAEGESGHAVAVYAESNASYLFFDPNIGVFRFTGGNLVKAAALLFGTYYDGFVDDSGGATGDYTIFGHAGACPPGVSSRAAVVAAGTELGAEQPATLRAAAAPAKPAAKPPEQSRVGGGIADRVQMFNR